MCFFFAAPFYGCPLGVKRIGETSSQRHILSPVGPVPSTNGLASGIRRKTQASRHGSALPVRTCLCMQGCKAAKQHGGAAKQHWGGCKAACPFRQSHDEIERPILSTKSDSELHRFNGCNPPCRAGPAVTQSRAGGARRRAAAAPRAAAPPPSAAPPPPWPRHHPPPPLPPPPPEDRRRRRRHGLTYRSAVSDARKRAVFVCGGVGGALHPMGTLTLVGMRESRDRRDRRGAGGSAAAKRAGVGSCEANPSPALPTAWWKRGHEGRRIGSPPAPCSFPRGARLRAPLPLAARRAVRAAARIARAGPRPRAAASPPAHPSSHPDSPPGRAAAAAAAA
jgi:hypothetical protein